MRIEKSKKKYHKDQQPYKVYTKLLFSDVVVGDTLIAVCTIQ